MHKRSYYVVNGITIYRLITAPVLVLLVFLGKVDLFKWLLAISFSTDIIDGYLARKFKVISRFGSKMDSYADDFTIIAAIVGMLVLKMDFIKQELLIVIVLLVLFFGQMVYALIKYKKISSFHTYAAKAAAVVQGSFLILIFILPEPLYPLFYAAAIITAFDLIEEIVLVYMLPRWKTNVKGIYWVMKQPKD